MSSLSFFFIFRRKSPSLPFVNGNIEKSYKFGAVYPQNFTFFQYRIVSICIRNDLRIHIRKIRIYGESYRELSRLWWDDTQKGNESGRSHPWKLCPPRREWKFSKKWSNNEKLSRLSNYLYLRVKSQRQSCSRKKKKESERDDFFSRKLSKREKKREEAFSFLFKGGQRDT